jgi:hypothetical protein
VPKVNSVDTGTGYYTNCTEYRVTTADGRTWSWSGVDEDQIRRDFFERGRLIQKIEVYSQWEAEMKRIDAQEEYRAEMETAAGNTTKEVA